MSGVTPSIRVKIMKEALAFYVGKLEFTLDRGGDNEANSVVSRGDARLMIETATDLYSRGYNVEIKQRLGTPSAHSLYIEASDLPDFQSRLQAAGVRIVDPLADRSWGQSEFTIEDGEGNWLCFWSASTRQ